MRFFIILLFITNLAFAQALKLSSEPAQFAKDIDLNFNKTLAGYGKTTIADFTNNFTNNFDATCQKEIITVFQTLARKNQGPNELIGLLETYNALYSKAKLDNGSLTNFSIGLKKSLENQSSKKIAETLALLLNFSTKSQLYTSNYSRIYALNGTFRFDYSENKKNAFSQTITADKTESETKKEDIGWGENQKSEEYDPWTDPNLNIKPNQQISNQNQLSLIQGLIIDFKELDLTLAGPSDSLVIQKTHGYFDVINNVFVGESGIMAWQIKNKKVKANFEKYFFKTQGTKFLADNVSLDFTDILKTPCKGVLEIKLEKRPAYVSTTFPRFKSYQNDAQLKLNLKNYSYSGGFTLVGTKVSSNSLFGNYSKIVINPNASNMFEVQSRNFEISDSLIAAERTSFVTKFDKDSVSHPAVKMNFDILKNELHLNKLEHGGFKNSMYSDTFHQVDIKCDAMKWNLNKSKMDFYIVAAKNDIPAVFESFNYYNPDRLRYLSTAAGFNPLFTAGNIVAKKKINSISLEEMQSATHLEKFQVANGMLIGNQMGFFDYDPISNLYSLSRKGNHYFLSFNGKTDFDDLVLTSITSGTADNGNASIDLGSKALDIKGTQDFKLSDSLGISFIPKDQSMQIVGNKVFTFNGEIVIKNYKFYGDFEVQYENFLVKLKRIDSIAFTPLAIYKKGGKTLLGSNMIFGKTGIVYLNSPDNKSGRKNLVEYPKLEIDKGAVVYFNEKNRQNKFKNEVNFSISSIKIDSLNATDPVFVGVFNSGGIFKPIAENLVVMPDSSLGISHKAKSTYTLYNTASTFKAETDIVLNKSGISSSGEISHLAAKFSGKEIKLFTDHLEAIGEKGKLTESQIKSGYFPEVSFSDYKMNWLPSEDSMRVESPKGFSFYNNSSQLTGKLVLRQAGLFGDGKIDRTDSDTDSDLIKFNKNGFLAEKANFNVKADQKDGKPVFTGKAVNLEFNVTNSIVKISPLNSDFNANQKSQLEFPFTSYITTIDNAIWSIKDKKITMSGALESSVFKSTAANQYGLKFNGTGANYDISGNNLNISGVQAINSADASIVPFKGLVAVKKDGMLEAFTHAKIIADTINRYHVLTNANVKINSKISFSGNADYQFINVKSDTFNIKLGNFEFAELSPQGAILSTKSSNKLSTIAKAKVSEKDGIYLSSKMLYRGEITMKAPFKNLYMNGAVIPELKKYPNLGGNWINYTGDKSEEISFNVDESLRDGGKQLSVGLHFLNGVVANALYPTFLQAKKSEEDADVFLVTGVFSRDEKNKRFMISPTTNQIGNRYDFYDDKGIIAMEGKFNLLGAPTKIFETVGVANLKLDSMKYQLSTMMKFEFPLPMATTQKMGQDIVKFNLDAGNSDAAIIADSPIFMAKLAQYVGTKESEEYRTKKYKEHIPLFKFSTKFLSTLVLSDVNLRWNAKSNSYYSVGKLGISNIGDVDINAMTDGFVEIVKSPLTGDEVNVLLEISPSTWYYFSYKDGELNMTSTDLEVNKLIAPAVDGKGKEKKSELVFVEAFEAQKFKRKFNSLYLGITETEAKKPLAKGVPDKNTKPVPITTKPVVPKKDEKDGF